MGARSAELLLALWERGRRCRPAERAIRLLGTAMPQYDTEELANFDLGLRDWHLLQLRGDLFGPALDGYIDCPHCHERLEIELDLRALQDPEPPASPVLYVTGDGHRFRLPNIRDLAAIADAPDSRTAARQLFRRCNLDKSLSPDAEESEHLFEEVDSGLAALADVRSVHLNLSCAICGGEWRHFLDLGEFLWEEIEAHASVLLDAVHRLAAAYGWTERGILAMSEARREAYLSRVD